MGLPAEKSGFTLADYLAWENAQPDARHEYVDGEIFLMVGARDTHNVITLNLAFALRRHLKGTPCRTYAEGIKLKVAAANCVFYPDVFVTCTPGTPVVKDHAVLVAEVLSPSTEAFDRGRKFGFYRQLPSLQEYLLVSGDEPRIELYRKNPEGQWTLHDIPADGTLHLESVGLDLTAAAVFEEVDFTPPAADPVAVQPRVE